MAILLDIDGVMVKAKPWSPPPLMVDGFAIFDSISISALNDIITKSKSGIILTTSHKYSYTLEEWHEILERRGIIVYSLERLPKNVNKLSRSEEIQNWFALNNKIENFVILDDDKSLNNLPKVLKDRLVLTKPLIGLNTSHIFDSLRILETPLELA